MPRPIHPQPPPKCHERDALATRRAGVFTRIRSSFPRYPGTRHTLLLGMLGAGRTFRDALDELQWLPADAWEAALTRPWLVRYQLEIKTLEPSEAV
ncbi:MAG: hypothetical protein MUF54_09530 [Polyangiaceae bacterium]|nr:hypothetical protein [Polyangiaceae bacterium]